LPETHFPVGYLPSQKLKIIPVKNAHEMQGVLMTILCLLLLNGQLHVEDCIGNDFLAQFAKVMELTLLHVG